MKMSYVHDFTDCPINKSVLEYYERQEKLAAHKLGGTTGMGPPMDRDDTVNSLRRSKSLRRTRKPIQQHRYDECDLEHNSKYMFDPSPFSYYFEFETIADTEISQMKLQPSTIPENIGLTSVLLAPLHNQTALPANMHQAPSPKTTILGQPLLRKNERTPLPLR